MSDRDTCVGTRRKVALVYLYHCYYGIIIICVLSTIKLTPIHLNIYTELYEGAVHYILIAGLYRTYLPIEL